MHFVLFVILYTYGEYRTIRYTGQITTAASLGKSGGQNQMMTLFANLSTFLLFREGRVSVCPSLFSILAASRKRQWGTESAEGFSLTLSCKKKAKTLAFHFFLSGLKFFRRSCRSEKKTPVRNDRLSTEPRCLSIILFNPTQPMFPLVIKHDWLVKSPNLFD